MSEYLVTIKNFIITTVQELLPTTVNDSIVTAVSNGIFQVAIQESVRNVIHHEIIPKVNQTLKICEAPIRVAITEDGDGILITNVDLDTKPAAKRKREEPIELSDDDANEPEPPTKRPSDPVNPYKEPVDPLKLFAQALTKEEAKAKMSKATSTAAKPRVSFKEQEGANDSTPPKRRSSPRNKDGNAGDSTPTEIAMKIAAGKVQYQNLFREGLKTATTRKEILFLMSQLYCRMRAYGRFSDQVKDPLMEHFRAWLPDQMNKKFDPVQPSEIRNWDKVTYKKGYRITMFMDPGKP
jgi:hypothetical protein